MRSISIESQRTYYGILLLGTLLAISGIIKYSLLFISFYFKEIPVYVVPIVQTLLYFLLISFCFFQRKEFPKINISVIAVLIVLSYISLFCYNTIVPYHESLACTNPSASWLITISHALYMIAIFIIAAIRFHKEKRKKG